MSVIKRIESLLEKGGKYLKLDVLYFAKGGFWLTASQIAGAAVSFILSVYLANTLPKESYGSYRYILSLASILGSFTLTGLNTAIIQSVARGYEGALRQAFKLSLRWSVASFLISIAGSGYYFYNENYVLGSALVIIAFAGPFLNSAGLFSSFINGKKDFRTQSLYTFIDNALPALAIIIAAFFTKNILLLIATYFISSTLIALILYFRTLKKFKPNDQQDGQIESYSIKLSVLNIITILTTQIDKVIVFTYLGPVELAIYGIALSFPEQIRGILRNMSSLLIPRFAERDITEQSVDVKGKTKKLASLFALITIAYALCAPILFKIFFPTYMDSIIYSQVYSLVIIASVAWIPGSIFISQKNDTELSKLSIYGSLIQIGVLVPLVYFFGLWGVIVAKMLGVYGNSVLSFILYKKNYSKKS